MPEEIEPVRRIRCYVNHPMCLEECAYHGAAHKEYQWGRRFDPRWTAEQDAAYQNGYDHPELAPNKWGNDVKVLDSSTSTD